MFRHATLILLEAVLVLGLLEDLAQGWLLAHTAWPPLLRVAAGIALSLALLTSVSLLAQRQIVVGLKTTHAIGKRLPLRVPSIVLHALALVGIFVAYAWLWERETGAFTAIRRLLPWS